MGGSDEETLSRLFGVHPGLRGDEDGRFFLDFNPECFSMVVEYLRNRRLRPDAPLPVVPQVQKRNMELLAEAWILVSILALFEMYFLFFPIG